MEEDSRLRNSRHYQTPGLTNHGGGGRGIQQLREALGSRVSRSFHLSDGGARVGNGVKDDFQEIYRGICHNRVDIDASCGIGHVGVRSCGITHVGVRVIVHIARVSQERDGKFLPNGPSGRDYVFLRGVRNDRNPSVHVNVDVGIVER